MRSHWRARSRKLGHDDVKAKGVADLRRPRCGDIGLVAHFGRCRRLGRRHCDRRDQRLEHPRRRRGSTAGAHGQCERCRRAPAKACSSSAAPDYAEMLAVSIGACGCRLGRGGAIRSPSTPITLNTRGGISAARAQVFARDSVARQGARRRGHPSPRRRQPRGIRYRPLLAASPAIHGPGTARRRARSARPRHRVTDVRATRQGRRQRHRAVDRRYRQALSIAGSGGFAGSAASAPASASWSSPRIRRRRSPAASIGRCGRHAPALPASTALGGTRRVSFGATISGLIVPGRARREDLQSYGIAGGVGGKAGVAGGIGVHAGQFRHGGDDRRQRQDQQDRRPCRAPCRMCASRRSTMFRSSPSRAVSAGGTAGIAGAIGVGIIRNGTEASIGLGRRARRAGGYDHRRRRQQAEHRRRGGERRHRRLRRRDLVRNLGHRRRLQCRRRRGERRAPGRAPTRAPSPARPSADTRACSAAISRSPSRRRMSALPTTPSISRPHR